MDITRRLVDATVACAVFALMAVELLVKSPLPDEGATSWVAFAWAVVIALPIALHRRFPGWVVPIVAAAVVGYSFGHYVAFPGYAVFVLVFLVSLHSGRGRGLLAFVVLAVALGVALGLQPAVTVTMSTWVSSLLALAVAWLAGENLRIRQARLLAVQERARRLEAERAEQARQAVAAERLRIARELHDVVAHTMSVIAVQAGVAHHAFGARPDLAEAALATVENGTRAALVEMRRLLGVLRHEDESSASLAPAPTLADLPGLVGQFRAVGLTVDLVVSGVPSAVPEGVELSTYRIGQEALTNVLRHGGPRASLRLVYQPGVVEIAVDDDGPPSPRPPGIIGGHGLVGMRERVAVFGGVFSAGPRPGGGFTVAATLPYADAVTVPSIPLTAARPT